MKEEIGQIDPREVMQHVRQALDELGADETIDTAIAFVVVKQLGEFMRQGYTKGKENSVREMIAISQQYKSQPKTIALGALIDAFLIGWIGVGGEGLKRGK